MMIDVDIYGSNGRVKKTVQVGKGSTRKFELMGDDYVLLKFSVSEPVYIAVGDYIDTDFGRFEIVEEQLPTLNATTGGYGYELRFDAPYKGWQNKIAMLCYKNTVNGSTAIIRKESEWNLTADISTQVQTAVIDNLNVLGEDYLGEPYAFAVDSSVSSAHKLCSYSSTSIYDAIVSIAETFECEWWVVGNVINFGKAEFGVDSEAINLTIGDNVTTMDSNKSSSEFATRYYVFGSTRNLRNYRKDDRGESVVLGVVTDRLMLPKGTDHIDTYKYDEQGKRVYLTDTSYNDADNVTMPIEEAIESTLVFDDVYPRNTGTASGVTIGREVTDEDENGVKTQNPIYWFKDTSFTFDTKYIIEGETMQVRFESGLLNGMTFDAAFNPDGASLKLDDGSYNPDAQVWEIVRNEDYGRLLPDDVLKPADGDKVLFTGFDISMVNEQFVSKAETELLDTAIDYIKKKSVDSQTYNCKIFCDVAKNGFTLELGQKCNLVNTAYFSEPRKSRVIGFEIPLDIPYDNPVYVIGESTAYSKLGNLSQKIDELTAKEERYKGGGGSSIYLIRSGDSTTVPSDQNAYSAKRADIQFLHRNKPDTAEGAITFKRQNVAEQGVQFGADFADGQSGLGGKIDGKGQGWLESLSLRSFLEAPEYRLNRISIQIGNRWRASGAGVIGNVVIDTDSEGRELRSGVIYLHLEDGEIGSLAVDDICQGIWHDGKTANNSEDDYDDGKGNFRFAGFCTSYFRITSVSSQGGKNNVLGYILRSDDRWNALHHPQPMMHFVAYGNFNDTGRQQSRYSTLTYERYLKGVNTWEFTRANIAAQFGDLSNLSLYGIDMTGYSAYLNNIYMSGTIQQIENADIVMEIADSLDGFIGTGETDTITCKLWRGIVGNDVTSLAEDWTIERESGVLSDDEVWNHSDKALNFNGTIDITLADLSKTHLSTLFNVTAICGNGDVLAKGQIKI